MNLDGISTVFRQYLDIIEINLDTTHLNSDENQMNLDDFG